MRFSAWSRGRRTIASVVVLAIAAGIPVTFAVLHDGFPVSDVTLNAKDVWVTNDQRALAGRLNRQIDELTASAQASSSSIDVVQDGAQVYLHDETANSLQRIERSRTTLVQKTKLPDNAEVELGKTTLTIVDPSSGKLWIVNVANGLSFDQSTVKPDVVLGSGGHATVGHDGVVYASSPSKSKLYTFQGAGSLPTVTSMKITRDNQISVVGDTAVILEKLADTLLTGGGKRIALHASPMKLQQPGAATSNALVATRDGLLRVPLSGGSPTAVQANIAPQSAANSVSSPVFLDGCDYGAWSGAERYVQQCNGGPVQRLTIEQATQGSQLEFRVNKNVIALNNLQNGNSWVLSSKLKLVNNWDEVTPPKESKTETGHQKTTEESFEDTLANRTPVNHAPIARPDQYGVRPGRTSILPVLNNDTDQDGDVLEITHISAVPASYGRIDEIDGGRALQFTPAASASGAQSFDYTVSDGRGGVADAQVNLAIVPSGENHAPVSVRQPSVNVETGQSITYDVLTDWLDPDGDELVVKSATPTSADGVQFTPDGYITFTNKSGQPGVKTVDYVVTDGTASTTGKLSVDVKAAGTLKPIGTPDFAQLFAGETAVVQPLQNDLSPSGQALTLQSVAGVPSTATVTPNVEKGTISVSSSTPGTMYLTYKLAAGAETSVGIIRVDVKPNSTADLPPVAVKDVAYLRQGQPTSVKVLDNDVSPTGKVLAVQSVGTEQTDPGVKVELLNNTVVRITAPNGLTKQTQFTYTISDGRHTAVAGVTVVPVAPIVARQPPVAVDDAQTVRAGDIASVDVLANDYDPDQEQMFLAPKLADVSGDGGGLAFVNGETVRYQAPSAPGQYSVVYRINDQYGESATARVTFNVTPRSKADNQPPVPSKQTARAFSGQTVRINVPLDGIDPDGDSVVLDGIAEEPLLGTITKSGPTWFDYKADSNQAGTDKFMYKVKDTYGAVGTGEIEIGVIPRSAVHSQPNAVNDSVEVKPGKTVSVQVLLNDSDPNGYPLALSKKLLSVSPALHASVSGAKVIIRAAKKAGLYNLRYEISNGQGGVDSAYVAVDVTPKAKVMYPTATDDYILDSQLHGSSPIKVDLSSFINNPNGLDSELVLTAEGPNAHRASINKKTDMVTVTPGDERYAIAYRVTDPDNASLSGTAFIVVPQAATKRNAPPPYVSAKQPQVVPMNQTRQWSLAKILKVPSGRKAIITDASTVTATDTDGTSAYVDPDTIRFTPLKDYRGPAHIVFEVTDGSSAKDPNGHKALLTLAISVGDPNQDDVAPTFTALDLPIQAGEAATTVDLRASTSHPNRNLIQDFQYGDLHGGSSQITPKLNGSKLSVSAPLGVQPGAKATISFTIHYKNFSVPGRVNVTVVSSTRPKAVVPPPYDVKGQRGHKITLNVLGKVGNPYADQNKPLKLMNAKIVNSAQTSASITSSAGGDVTILPDASFIGAVTVAYTVRDASDDPNRDVQGQFNLVVRDVPSQPAAPKIVNEDDKQVTISWQAPATNGEPILDYTITTSGGIGQKTVSASAAETTITGLTNGNNYTFQISARNALGDSTISKASATASPFGTPGAPASAKLTASATGDGKLSMAWGDASGNGRSVSSYRWTMSGASPSSGTVSGTTHAATATGHVGTSYTFSVVAIGPTGKTSAARTSAAVVPQPGAPTSAKTAVGSAGSKTVTMTWGGGGSTEAFSFWISINSAAFVNEGSATSHTFSGSFDTAYSFRVEVRSAGLTSAIKTSNSATPTKPNPSVTIVSRSAAAHMCSDGADTCHAAVVQGHDLTSGAYALYLQVNTGGGWGDVGSYHTPRQLSSGGYAQSSETLANPGANAQVRVEVVGPSGTIDSPGISASAWLNLPSNDHGTSY